MIPNPTRRRFIGIAAAAAGAAHWPDGAHAGRTKVHRWRGVALGANAELLLHHEDADAARRLTDACLAEVRRLEAVFSLYRADSAISQLNRHGQLDDPPPELVTLLSIARTVSERTGGAFDVTVQPLWRLYAVHAAVEHQPSAASIARARALVDYSAMDISAARIGFARAGMAITLNGIAQGYITDAVTDLLRRAGMEDVLINMGEIRGSGAHPDGRPWRVALDETDLDPVDLHNRAVATSAGSGFIFGGDPSTHHLFDPTTGRCTAGWQSVSVIADRATTADALSTAFMSMERADVSRVAAELGCNVIAVPNDGKSIRL